MAYRMNDGDWTDCEQLFDKSKAEIAVHENGMFTFRITDPHGHTFEESIRVAVIDRSAPTVKASITGTTLQVEVQDDLSGVAGVQVNARDWHLKMSPETRAKFDFILADALIIPHADGSSTKLWEIKSVENTQKWMEIYFAHNMRILDEPVTIFANPTYLPKPLQSMYDELWTDERLEAFMSKAARKGIVLEIQAESFAQANPRFLAAAKKHKVKFSFGSDNLTGRAQNLDSWAKAVELGNLTPSDFWTPPERR